jgi:nitroreductase
MTVAETIRTQRAVRRYTEQPLPEDAVRAILDAGRRAQSSKNTQPWHFIAVRDRAMLRQLATCGVYAGHLAGAALAVVIVAPQPTGFDQGQAAACMQLAAWDLGIGSCIASIYEPDKARALLGIPGDLHCDVAIGFGYPAEQQRAAPRPGGRRPFAEVVHWERW